MTKEEKQLLLIDLCARLPYGVKVHIDNDGFYDKREPYDTILTIQWSQCLKDLDRETGPDAIIIRPYLRAMSSMTEEEDKEWQSYKVSIAESCERRLEEKISALHDWFNSRHLDWRGLIPMGLALEAPEGMYNR